MRGGVPPEHQIGACGAVTAYVAVTAAAASARHLCRDFPRVSSIQHRGRGGGGFTLPSVKRNGGGGQRSEGEGRTG